MKNGTDDGFFDCVNDNPQSMLSDYFSYVWPTLKARYVWFLTHHTFSRSAIQTVTRYIYSPSPRFCCKHFSLYFWPPTSSCFHLSYHRCFSPPLALPLSSLNRGNLQFYFFFAPSSSSSSNISGNKVRMNWFTVWRHLCTVSFSSVLLLWASRLTFFHFLRWISGS